MSDDRLAELITVRDWLRHGVSRFNEAGLAYGHGTERALDEAVFMILTSLNLEPDTLDPWLDARLTRSERARIDAAFEARITTRKPAPYIVGASYIRGHRFRCDERAIVPRSFIGELICDRMDEGEEHFPPLPVHAQPTRILDLCTGGGSLAVLAALAFPDAEVDGIDISRDALDLAREVCADYGLEDRVRLIESDLFTGIAGKVYDLIISNPPYVREASVHAFPPEHKAEPVLAHSGGPDGLDIVRRILADAGSHLAPGGQIVIEIGDGREALTDAFPELDFVWVETRIASGEVVALPASALQRQPGGGGAQRKGRKQGRMP